MKQTKEEIETEFNRIVECVKNQGDINCITDLITLERKKQFIEEWKEE